MHMIHNSNVMPKGFLENYRVIVVESLSVADINSASMLSRW
jgi:hypothetical protein